MRKIKKRKTEYWSLELNGELKTLKKRGRYAAYLEGSELFSFFKSNLSFILFPGLKKGSRMVLESEGNAEKAKGGREANQFNAIKEFCLVFVQSLRGS